MSDAFDAIFADASKVSATVKVKLPDGRTRTGKLSRGPADMAPESFAEAGMHGTTFRESATDGDRERARNRKDVTGAAARSAIMAILGLTVPAPKKDKATPADKPTATV